MRTLFSLQSLAIALLLSLGVACSDQNTEQQAMVRQAAAIEQADECHLCGMIISRFPGPKGESYSKSTESVSKFCSTRDLFSYILQPENQRQVKEIYVHDMSKTPWQKPEDEYFIDAREAWYVIGSEKKGAMGKTLASFARQEDANSFMAEFGGKVYQFDEISIEML
ncbi:nitrous oxide reductase accessory protein NosL [Photobacterium atrarenae]|uniref:Nitrous oxide reductase accessory protein NosL n=1 Tax=Photobacterium atrarenae TaxID=865757 RepID=A0ABY5GJX1_9GAMM|nr:nitrous oxide reductase accessory protein NosL [Photobacterium atrarenae]UTV29446.1 nitrous oxide reductase accessory protein NosL [Photobacterium atrarenae]